MSLEISQKYKDILKTGNFQSLLCSKPWSHYVLDNFIEEADFKRIQPELCAPQDYELYEQHPAKIRLRYMENVELAKLFFSNEVRDLFEGIAGSKLNPNEQIAIQLRQMNPSSPEFGAHVDLLEFPSLVALYYVAPNWKPGCGGEIVLRRDEHSPEDHPENKWVAPVENRLLLFMTSENGWHSVKKVNNWIRTMVLTEWLEQPRTQS